MLSREEKWKMEQVALSTKAYQVSIENGVGGILRYGEGWKELTKYDIAYEKDGKTIEDPEELFAYHEALREAQDQLDVLEGLLVEAPNGTLVSLVIIKNKVPHYEKGQTLTQEEWDAVLGKKSRVYY